jgi:hypothetical protein
MAKISDEHMTVNEIENDGNYYLFYLDIWWGKKTAQQQKKRTKDMMFQDVDEFDIEWVKKEKIGMVSSSIETIKMELDKVAKSQGLEYKINEKNIYPQQIDWWTNEFKKHVKRSK